jgi:hypothetical protein
MRTMLGASQAAAVRPDRRRLRVRPVIFSLQTLSEVTFSENLGNNPNHGRENREVGTLSRAPSAIRKSPPAIPGHRAEVAAPK